MNEQKPIYSIKSRNGQILIQGDFSAIVTWLREKRIKNDDDLKRDGLHVLEKDELWGRVSDFPEIRKASGSHDLNFTEREGRRALHLARARANIWLLISGVIFLLGIGLVCYDQVIPRYTEAQRVNDAVEKYNKSKAAEALANLRADEAEAKANKKIEDSVKVSNAKYKALEENNRNELSKLSQEAVLLRESMSDNTTKSREAQNEIAAAKAKITKLTDDVASSKSKTTKLMDDNAQLKLQILKFEKEHSLYHPERKH